MTEKRNILLFLIFTSMINTSKTDISEEKDDAVIIKNIVWPDYEKNVGAYYLVYSPYSIGYSKVTTYVHLPASVNTNGGKRNAFISCGVLGRTGFLDTGIMNSGSGWIPCYCLNKTLKAYPEYLGIEGVKIVGIEVEVTSSKIVIFSLSFRDSNLNILKSFSTEIDASSILEHDSNGNVKNRFYRFASLVNDIDKGVPDNQNDQTYMINGIFTNLCIVVNGKVEPWGISSDFVELGWIVSSKKLEFSYADDHESFSIKHYASLTSSSSSPSSSSSSFSSSSSSESIFLNLSFLQFIIILIYLI